MKRKFKKIEGSLKESIESEILMMLAAHRDTLWNLWGFSKTGGRPAYNPNEIRLDVGEGFYGEAFGIIRCLALLGYGYIGSDTQDGIEENRGGTQPEHNLKWWLGELVRRILDETNYPNSTANGTYNVLDKYRKLSICHRNEKKLLKQR